MHPIKKVALVAPSVSCRGPLQVQDKWLNYLHALGLEVVVMPSAANSGILTTFQAKQKAEDIMTAYADPSVDALIATHGGASSLRVLEYLDYDLIAHNPKPLIGFSDCTTIQMGIFARTKQPYITGFMPERDFRYGDIDPLVDKGWHQILAEQNFKTTSGVPVHSGQAEGVLLGGNLASMLNLFGTRYQPDLSQSILLLEDVDEQAYNLKQMLTQLKYNPNFATVQGIVFGTFTECQDHVTHGTVDSVVEDFAAQVNLPMIKDFNYGHGNARFVMTCGVKYRLTADTACLEQIS
jgi:muramoyltetrapeptide carboxypeptidase